MRYLQAWADRLYMVSYLSVDNGGSGTGLYEIDANLTITKIAEHSTCYANRIMYEACTDIEKRVAFFVNVFRLHLFSQLPFYVMRR